MAAGPRDTPPGRDTSADSGSSHESRDSHGVPEPRTSQDPLGSPEPGEPLDRLGSLNRLEPLGALDGFDGIDAIDGIDAVGGLEPIEAGELLPPMEGGQSFRELRPPRRLHIWQIAPIIALAVGGSLMFAFPLAFESGDAGSVVAMLGLLLCCCAAGWGLMAARRIGQTWPGLPPRGSGARPDWRFVAGYAAVIVLLAVLAVVRVARLR
jgi:hypothetical protein